MRPWRTTKNAAAFAAFFLLTAAAPTPAAAQDDNVAPGSTDGALDEQPAASPAPDESREPDGSDAPAALMGTSVGDIADDSVHDDAQTPEANAGILGNLSGEDAETMFGVGGLGLQKSDPQAVQKYLTNMLWLDETRVATGDSAGNANVHREYAFFHGQDKRAIDLDELLTIAGAQDELAHAQSVRSLNLWTITVPTWGLFAGGLAGLVIGAAGGALYILQGLGTPTAPIQSVPAFSMFLGGLGAWAALWAGALTWGIVAGLFVEQEQIAEHDLRRIVREHNERLRDEYGVDAKRDKIPTGLSE